MTPVLYLTRQCYINVNALKHWRKPLSEATPECAAARGAYSSIAKRDGTAPKPCEICAAVEKALHE